MAAAKLSILLALLADVPTSSASASGLLSAAYLGAIGVAAIFGLHRYWLVLAHRGIRGRIVPAPKRFAELPRVTIQLPMYNEAAVARRLIEATCRIRYPAKRLQIQVLDDSTDACERIARRAVARMQAAGHDIVYLHRSDRHGYKAGALEAGLAGASGELIAIFDADFVPPEDFLLRTVHHFSDPLVGVVQASWDHLNRGESLLTQSQAIFLDAHFHIEHTVRNRSGLWMNFNGTAGIWRRTAIASAGGWQHDTLTEDVDLSYRAQLAGWRFVYLPELRCPAELPPTMAAFKTQQYRWTKGTVQSARKLLPRILRASVGWRVKLEAAFHLLSPVVYPCVVLIALLLWPAVWAHFGPFKRGTWSDAFFGLAVLLLATASGSIFYLVGQRAATGSMRGAVLRIPALLALGVGLSCNNTRAVLQALLGRVSPFVRTPKYLRGGFPEASGEDPHSERAAPPPRHRSIETAGFELVLAAYLVVCIGMALRPGPTLWAVPFLAIFAAGYLWVGLGSLGSAAPRRWSAPAVEPGPAGGSTSEPKTSPPPLLAGSRAPATSEHEHTGR